MNKQTRYEATVRAINTANELLTTLPDANLDERLRRKFETMLTELVNELVIRNFIDQAESENES